MERRQFLSTGSVSALALAAGYTSGFSDTRSDSPAESVREYYLRAADAETVEEFAADIPDVAHSVSPLIELAADTQHAFDETVRQRLIDAEVIDEDISASAIRAISDFLTGSVSDEAIERIAEQNAIVAATLEADTVIGGELATEWLVAPDDGAWRVVWPDSRNSPRAAVRRFFRQITQTEYPGQLTEPISELSHSSSPLANIADYTPWYFRGLRRQQLRRTEVTAENIDIRTIATTFTPIISWAQKSEVEAIAEQNAVVDVSLSDDRVDVAEFDQQWLVAPDDGEWRVVWF